MASTDRENIGRFPEISPDFTKVSLWPRGRWMPPSRFWNSLTGASVELKTASCHCPGDQGTGSPLLPPEPASWGTRLGNGLRKWGRKAPPLALGSEPLGPPTRWDAPPTCQEAPPPAPGGPAHTPGRPTQGHWRLQRWLAGDHSRDLSGTQGLGCPETAACILWPSPRGQREVTVARTHTSVAPAPQCTSPVGTAALSWPHLCQLRGR